MAILHFFTPERAITLFVLLLLFFMSISFPTRRTVLFIVTLYAWRAGVFVIADAVQSVFDASHLSFMRIAPEAVMAACDALLLYILYGLFKKYMSPGQKQFPWPVNFVLYISLVILFVSTVYMAFPAQATVALPSIGHVLFENPLFLLGWYVLPLLIAFGANAWIKGSTKKVRVNE